ncbi:30S ribosomal protein 2, chloroplastic [Momordica charantia]|uniref:Small ribosomal subunit protein cS22 n=1 Tax=Momordica charantia TaxID=3673 RepID=A0A6J1DHV7_MOMCH|nr:30S ribosomal protein 2, chloroplastic [Momordica charantia]
MASLSSILSPPNLIHSSTKPTETPHKLSNQFLRPISFHRRPPLLRLSSVLQTSAAKHTIRLFAVAEAAVTAQDPSSAAARRLYIGNIPRNVDNEQLTRIVEEHGAVEKAEVMYDKYSGRSRRFAFVTMKTVDDANAVIEKLNETEVEGRTIKVNITEKPLVTTTSVDLSLLQAEESQFIDSPYKVYVGNISSTVSTETLKKLFSEKGNVLSAKVSRVPGTSKSSGYGFVTFSSEEEVETAISSFNNALLEGQAIRVNKA